MKISLREIFLLMLVFGLGLGWCLSHRQSEQELKKVVEEKDNLIWVNAELRGELSTLAPGPQHRPLP